MGLFGFRREEVLDINKVASEREKDSLLIDVREPDEYEEGHLPGSINIPVGTIGNTELNCNKDKKI
ncbi:MAG: rhodanese-like domain-containing protein, partial [Solobacterium sp.]|nr:rhodanese-like domain-containing protein [Solobacterium sp.]